MESAYEYALGQIGHVPAAGTRLALHESPGVFSGSLSFIGEKEEEELVL